MTFVTINTAHQVPCHASRGHSGTFKHILSLLSLRKSRDDLARLDHHMLEDVGLTVAEAKSEAKRPIWDVPSNWRI